MYADGFGDIEDIGDLWLGLDNIHALCNTTQNNCTLRVDMVDPNFKGGNLVWAKYSHFAVNGPHTNYTLRFGGYNTSSTVGNAMLYPIHLSRYIPHEANIYTMDNMQFSSVDNVNDDAVTMNCAAKTRGG